MTQNKSTKSSLIFNKPRISTVLFSSAVPSSGENGYFLKSQRRFSREVFSLEIHIRPGNFKLRQREGVGEDVKITKKG